MNTKTAPYRHTSDGSNCYTGPNCKRNNSPSNGVLSFQGFYAGTPGTNQSPPAEHIKPKQSGKTPTEMVKSLQAQLEKEHGVKLYLSHSAITGFVVVDKIIVPKENRQNGVGTKVMNKIINEADKNGWHLALTPSTDFGSSKIRLENFYKKLGFRRNFGNKRDFTTMESYIRYHK